MNAMDCLNILRNIKDCAFATVDENGMPQNRIIDVMIVEYEKWCPLCKMKNCIFSRRAASIFTANS